MNDQLARLTLQERLYSCLFPSFHSFPFNPHAVVHDTRSTDSKALSFVLPAIALSGTGTHIPPVCLESALLQNAESLQVEIKLVLLLCSLDLRRVCFFQIALNNVVPVLSHRSQTSLLHDRSNDGTR